MNSEETTEDTTPRVYVASLADYNNGDLLGRWFALGDYEDADELMADIQAMLKTYDKLYPLPYGSVREEWAAHDYENFPERLYSESMDFAKVFEYLAAVVDFDEERREAYDAFIEDGNEPAYFADRYQGRYGEGYHYDEEKVLADYAETSWLESHSADEIPASLRNYIDWVSLGSDYQLSGDVWTSNGHVFLT